MILIMLFDIFTDDLWIDYYVLLQAKSICMTRRKNILQTAQKNDELPLILSLCEFCTSCHVQVTDQVRMKGD